MTAALREPQPRAPSRVRRRLATLAALLAALLTGGVQTSAADAAADGALSERTDYRVIAVHPHDPEAFTQGLILVDGELIESTGGYGASSLRRVALASGRVLQRVDLPPRLFGEGITRWGEEIVQLTWRAGIGRRYGLEDLRLRGEFGFDGEGWGLTADASHWILSDGSDQLRFLDPADGRELRRIAVRENGRPVTRLNELEYIDGEVWANIWHRDRVVRIDPASGRVLGRLDLSGLWPAGRPRRPEQVLNGIAYDAASGHVLVTGKRWPLLFELAVDGVPGEVR